MIAKCNYVQQSCFATYCGAISNGTIPLTAVSYLATSCFTPFARSFDRLLPSGNLRSLDSCGGWNLAANSSELICSSTLFARIPMCFVTASRILSSVSVHTPTWGGFEFPQSILCQRRLTRKCIASKPDSPNLAEMRSYLGPSAALAHMHHVCASTTLPFSIESSHRIRSLERASPLDTPLLPSSTCCPSR